VKLKELMAANLLERSGAKTMWLVRRVRA
jgi:hypothetical protein